MDLYRAAGLHSTPLVGIRSSILEQWLPALDSRRRCRLAACICSRGSKTCPGDIELRRICRNLEPAIAQLCSMSHLSASGVEVETTPTSAYPGRMFVAPVISPLGPFAAKEFWSLAGPTVAWGFARVDPLRDLSNSNLGSEQYDYYSKMTRQELTAGPRSL